MILGPRPPTLESNMSAFEPDSAAIDERLCIRDPAGNILNYEDRGVIALLIGKVADQQKQINALLRR